MDFPMSASPSTRLPNLAAPLEPRTPCTGLVPLPEFRLHNSQSGRVSPNPPIGNGFPQLPSLKNLLNPPIPSGRPSASASPSISRLPSLASFDRGVPSEPLPHVLPALAVQAPAPSNFTISHGHHPFQSALEDSRFKSDARQHQTLTKQSSNSKGPVSAAFSPASRTETLSSDGVAESDQSANIRVDLSRTDLSRPDLSRPDLSRPDLSRAPPRVAQCIGKQEISGEGVCYIYEDGSYCRTVIDGEAVNPSWGVTKAGKPRKRLAQACLTCREKKIKCEPGAPKCAQCTRARRVCRGGVNQQNDSGTDKSVEPENGKKRPADVLSPVKPPYVPAQPLYVREGSTLLDATELPNKRRLISEKGERAYGTDQIQRNTAPVSDMLHVALENYPLETKRHLRGGYTLIDDPFEADPQLSIHLLELFFEHINSATYSMFPQMPFTAWATNRQKKSMDDKMLLYSVLSMASVFASDDEYRDAEEKFVEAAMYAIQHRVGQWSLQLCQSRLIIGLWCFARGLHDDAFDHCGMALRALSALNINYEAGIKTPSEGEYGFDQPMLEECRRRTFWAGFLMDRYNGFCGGTLFTIQPEDIFLRLPCAMSAYESGRPIAAPIYEGGAIEADLEHWSNIGYMGHLVMISAIWSDVWLGTVRSSRHSTSSSGTAYEEFYTRTCRRLDEWLTRLPRPLAYSTTNLDTAIADGYAGTFLSMHALYHTTMVRLNRHVRHAKLTRAHQMRNIERARVHATSLLNIMSALSSRLERFHFSTPFPGYAVMIATDVLSAGGVVSALPTLLALLSSGLACIDEIARFWASARAQQKAVRKRLQCLMQMAVGEVKEVRRLGVGVGRSGAGAEMWRGEKALDNVFEMKEDILYGVGDQVFVEAVGGSRAR